MWVWGRRSSILTNQIMLRSKSGCPEIGLSEYLMFYGWKVVFDPRRAHFEGFAFEYVLFSIPAWYFLIDFHMLRICLKPLPKRGPYECPVQGPQAVLWAAPLLGVHGKGRSMALLYVVSPQKDRHVYNLSIYACEGLLLVHFLGGSCL